MRDSYNNEDEKLENEIEELESLICEDIENGIPVTEATNKRIAQAMLKAQHDGSYDR